MKKLFFSVVALVAFSSVSMGSTITVEDKKANNEKETKALPYDNKCVTYAANKLEAAEAQSGFTYSCEMREHLFWTNYNRCLDKSVCAE